MISKTVEQILEERDNKNLTQKDVEEINRIRQESLELAEKLVIDEIKKKYSHEPAQKPPTESKSLKL